MKEAYREMQIRNEIKERKKERNRKRDEDKVASDSHTRQCT
jgi:hypothetical protein